MVIEKVKKHGKYVIYGAQVVAVGAYEAIMHLTGIKPECFAVSKPQKKTFCPDGNPESIEGIKVISIEEVPKDMLIVVGVTELIQREVLPYLKENGYNNFFPLTQHEEHLLMSEYFKSIDKFPVVSSEKPGDRDFILYEVKNDRDKPLSFHPELKEYEKTIQAGAALASTTIAEITDDSGENISVKNRMYCEMSAVYWIWKNTHHDWVGIEHYRRHLLISPEMLTDDIDVIMPLPYICYPDEMSQFLRFTTEKVLDALIKALKALHPDEYEDYHKILYGRYQYTYNMVCARREVFDDYCSWFFEITNFMEDNFAREVPELVETRAFSYVAEVLTNLYFMYHQKDLRIRHIEKAIYT